MMKEITLQITVNSELGRSRAEESAGIVLFVVFWRSLAPPFNSHANATSKKIMNNRRIFSSNVE
jgi:hypothetical protein